MMKDYIVVGLGLAGIAFCEQLRAHNKSFVVFDPLKQSASRVASGLYNPINLNRFTMSWKGDQLMRESVPLYADLEQILQTKMDYNVPIQRRLLNPLEVNNWQYKASQRLYEHYMESNIQMNKNIHVNAPMGMGFVRGTGRVDCNVLIDSYSSFINHQMEKKTFDYSALQISNTSFTYNNIAARHIVFTEGIGITDNPWFSWLPIQPNKGELMTIFAPNLKTNTILKAGVFILPLGKGYYRVGATYSRNDNSSYTTEDSRKGLEKKLQQLIKCTYEVKNQQAGVRPTVQDHRITVGYHPKYPRMGVINGLGSRGVLLAPYAAKALFYGFQNNTSIDTEISVSRFYDH